MTSQPFPVDIPFIRRSRQGQTKSFSLQNAAFLVGRPMIAVTKKLHDLFTLRLEAKNSSSGPTYSFL